MLGPHVYGNPLTSPIFPFVGFAQIRSLPQASQRRAQNIIFLRSLHQRNLHRNSLGWHASATDLPLRDRKAERVTMSLYPLQEHGMVNSIPEGCAAEGRICAFRKREEHTKVDWARCEALKGQVHALGVGLCAGEDVTWGSEILRRRFMQMREERA